MRILPPKTLPPNKAIAYRHIPAEGRYSTYRECLRWDFGFTCGFCLVHEADVTREGRSEGLGIFSIEHILPQSQNETEKNVYRNCVYCCQKCNRSRSTKPTRDPTGRQLLNPTVEVWAAHFELFDDKLSPKTGDIDAEYTHEAYDIDEPRKVEYRKCRRQLYDSHFQFLNDRPESKIDELLRLAQTVSVPAEIELLVSTAQVLRNNLKHAVADLATYAAVTSDAPKRCRCNTTTEHTLPEEMKNQTIELRDA